MKNQFIFCGLASIFALTLVACGQSESAYRAEFRQNGMATCVKGMTTGPDAVVTEFSRNYCSCLTEQMLTLPINDLRRLETDKAYLNQVLPKMIAKCMVDGIETK